MACRCISSSQVAHLVLNETVLYEHAANRMNLQETKQYHMTGLPSCYFAGNLLLQAKQGCSFSPAPPLKNLYLCVISVYGRAAPLSCSQSLPAGPASAQFTFLWQTGGARQLQPTPAQIEDFFWCWFVDSLAAETGLWFTCEMVRLDDRRLWMGIYPLIWGEQMSQAVAWRVLEGLCEPQFTKLVHDIF